MMKNIFLRTLSVLLLATISTSQLYAPPKKASPPLAAATARHDDAGPSSSSPEESDSKGWGAWLKGGVIDERFAKAITKLDGTAMGKALTAALTTFGKKIEESDINAISQALGETGLGLTDASRTIDSIVDRFAAPATVQVNGKAVPIKRIDTRTFHSKGYRNNSENYTTLVGLDGKDIMDPKTNSPRRFRKIPIQQLDKTEHLIFKINKAVTGIVEQAAKAATRTAMDEFANGAYNVSSSWANAITTTIQDHAISLIVGGGSLLTLYLAYKFATSRPKTPPLVKVIQRSYSKNFATIESDIFFSLEKLNFSNHLQNIGNRTIRTLIIGNADLQDEKIIAYARSQFVRNIAVVSGKVVGSLFRSGNNLQELHKIFDWAIKMHYPLWITQGEEILSSQEFLEWRQVFYPETSLIITVRDLNYVYTGGHTTTTLCKELVSPIE
jgi:hypothetical protein